MSAPTNTPTNTPLDLINQKVTLLKSKDYEFRASSDIINMLVLVELEKLNKTLTQLAEKENFTK